MDEIFHVPQAVKYCQGRFREWDDKITTLPGLYLFTIGALNPLAHAYAGINGTAPALAMADICSTAGLRAVNLGLSALTLVVLNLLVAQIHGGKHYYDPAKAALSAFNMSLLPVLYFFSFLYYTDVGSTLMVLLAYCLHLDGRDWAASMVGGLAVSFRQTNIMWVAFVAAQAAYPFVLQCVHERMLEGKEDPARFSFSLTTVGQVREVARGLFLLLREPLRLLELIKDILINCGGYVIVWLLFVAFVAVNDGVVVGDRSAHEVNFHPTQVLYFCGFTLALTWPYHATKLARFAALVRKHPAACAAALATAAAVVSGFHLEHRYLVADNRHFTFYVWRRIVNATWWSRFALVPLYLYGGFCILHSIRRTGAVFQLAYPVMVAACLAPQLLLEFRYFILPFMFYRLQVRPMSWTKLILETLTCLAVNAATISLFVLRPFRWEHEPDAVQRFMW